MNFACVDGLLFFLLMLYFVFFVFGFMHHQLSCLVVCLWACFSYIFTKFSKIFWPPATQSKVFTKKIRKSIDFIWWHSQIFLHLTLDHWFINLHVSEMRLSICTCMQTHAQYWKINGNLNLLGKLFFAFWLILTFLSDIYSSFYIVTFVYTLV